RMHSALPFRLRAFALPADFFQLFLVVAVVIYRFQTLAGAMHTLALTVLGACAVRDTLVIHWTRIARTAAVAVVVVGLGIVATRTLLTQGVVAAGPRRAPVRERTRTG